MTSGDQRLAIFVGAVEIYVLLSGGAATLHRNLFAEDDPSDITTATTSAIDLLTRSL